VVRLKQDLVEQELLIGIQLQLKQQPLQQSQEKDIFVIQLLEHLILRYQQVQLQEILLP